MGLTYPICGSASPRTHLILVCSTHAVFINQENQTKALQIVILWHCKRFIAILNPVKCAVECINFDCVSCVFVRRTAQLHLIGYVRARNVKNQYPLMNYLTIVMC